MKRACSLATIVALVSVGLSATAPAADSPADLAKNLIKEGGVTRGVCAVLGAGDGKLALEIVRNSGLMVHVLDSDAQAITAARKTLDVDGLWVKRVTAEVGSARTLPYADNTIDLIVAAKGSQAARTMQPKELLRALRPGGKGILYDPDPADWKTVVKPKPEGTDDWSHWYKGIDNNPVSNDQVIKAPYRSQWFGRPWYIPMPSNTVAAGGRIFLAMGHIAHHKREWGDLNKLIARNGYNGQILWERQLPDGYMVHRSAFIATDKVFYMIDGDRALKLDPETGKEIGEVRIPKLSQRWDWMAMDGDTIYVLSGAGSKVEMKRQATKHGHWSWQNLSKGYYEKPVPWGQGKTLTAYNMKSKKVLWTHTEKKPMDSRALAIGGGKVFCYAPGLRITCLNATSGSVEWDNSNPEVMALIEEKGRGLISTPGFRSSCYTLYTPKAILFEAQTRMNLVALSPADGKKLWVKQKVTNNPNPIFVDNKVIIGVGERGRIKGTHLVIDPVSGEVLKDLRFAKHCCVRLTATPDSLFVRGEGLLRFDRNTGQWSVNGALRASCNDGAIGANGMLYVGPWQCDCNLSLIGTIGMCSAGDARLDIPASNKANLEVGEDLSRVKKFSVTAEDWSTYRADIQRSGGTSVAVVGKGAKKWHYRDSEGVIPTPPVTAGGLVFLAGQDGKVRAIDAASGAERWVFLTAGPILMPPTVANGRVYVGSGDGHAYALEAATGRLLWRFRGGPRRKIMLYETLASSWPVNTGVLVHDGVAYFAAGIIDYDGTYVYALDATTGKIKWQNTTSGHLNKELRKGVSAQGTITILDDKLILAGGNQINPASFSLATGECLDTPRKHGRPQADSGQMVAVFKDKYVLYGGRLLYSAIEKVIHDSTYYFRGPRINTRFSAGRTAPVWNNDTLAYVHGVNGKLFACDADKMVEAFGRPNPPKPKNQPRWRWRPYIIWRLGKAEDPAQPGKKVRVNDWRWVAPHVLGEHVLGIAVAGNAILAAVEIPPADEGGKTTWMLYAFDSAKVTLPNNPKFAGKPKLLWQVQLPVVPLQDGLAVDRDGRVIVACHNGGVLCYGK